MIIQTSTIWNKGTQRKKTILSIFVFLLRFEMLWRTKFACPICSKFDYTGVTSSCEVRTCRSLNSLERNRIIAGLVSTPILHPLYFEPQNALVCKSGWSLVQVSNCQITVPLLGPQRYNTVAKSDMGLCHTSKTVSFLWKKREPGPCTSDHHRGW